MSSVEREVGSYRTSQISTDLILRRMVSQRGVSTLTSGEDLKSQKGLRRNPIVVHRNLAYVGDRLLRISGSRVVIIV